MDECPAICALNVGRDTLGSHGGDPEAAPMGDRVIVTVAICPVVAERLAEHKRSRVASGSDVLAAEAREVADPVLEALVAAGFGD